MDGPRADFLFPCREIRPEAEQMIRRSDQRTNTAFLDAELLQECVRLVWRQIHQVALDLRADDDGFAGEVRLDVVADLQHIRIRVGGCEVRLPDVARKDRRLVGEQEERRRHGALFRRERHGHRRLASVQRGFDPGKHRIFHGGRLVPALHFLAHPLATLPHRLEVGQHQLGVDHLDVSHRVDGPRHVVHIRILEAPHDLDDRIHFADVRQELVAQSFALARTLDEPRDVHELDRRRDHDVRLRDLLQRREPDVRNTDDADIGINRAKRVIGRFRLSRAGDSIEQCGFAHVREADDSSSQHNGMNRVLWME
jgi:hypothetical protein